MPIRIVVPLSPDGAEADYPGPERFGAQIQNELPRWANVVKATKMEINETREWIADRYRTNHSAGMRRKGNGSRQGFVQR